MAQKIGAFITITNPDGRGDTFWECYRSAKELFDTVTIVDGDETWPREFSWETIGEHFQKGYEQTDADWVFHLDTDFIFHEKDFERIRQACSDWKNDAAGLTFLKWQFILPHAYNIKSRLVLAVNKKRYGDRIRFDSGGDLCQPSIDGAYIRPEEVPRLKIPIYNYEKMLKTKTQIYDDVGRMARAWQRKFGEYKLGGPDDKSAYNQWYKMVEGRYNKPKESLPLHDHPRFIRETILNLNPDQWGYCGFGLEEMGHVATT